MAKDNKEKQQPPPTTQNPRAPQDENPMTTPRPSPKKKNSEKTINK